MRPLLLPLVSLIGLLVAGCPTPTQYGGPIAVDTDGFAARMAWLCHWGVHGGQEQACFDPNAKEKEDASADRPDAGPPVTTRPSAERPKVEPAVRPSDKPAPTDAGAAKDQEPAADAGASAPAPSADASTGPKPEHDDGPGSDEPPTPPDSPSEESTGRR